VLPAQFRNQAQEQLWMLNCGRFSRLKKNEREYLVCRIHGRPGGGIRPRFGIKRQPMRLLIDYGEGVSGIMWDFYCRRWTDLKILLRFYWEFYWFPPKSREKSENFDRKNQNFRSKKAKIFERNKAKKIDQKKTISVYKNIFLNFIKNDSPLTSVMTHH